MTNALHKKLLIKQVIGRLLLDTDQSGCAFTLEPDGDGWLIRVQSVPTDAGHEIKRLEDDLNLFYFEDNKATGELRKWWLYDLDVPAMDWDAGQQTLTLRVSSRVGYTNEKV
ncbi:hypothetical protein [Paenibacillus methanolicus]|uniref:Uncharacterized protein n=1 Tax=Paenibacillus methanolicus TaxID=582686 RepID=A0A5S5BT46_9BACL|nr:hypothetical protein [Paenibacillus methanolicus]TYP70114.1 hypothetical protein BCM02_11292 [Paenibacillus methanolicus]